MIKHPEQSMTRDDLGCVTESLTEISLSPEMTVHSCGTTSGEAGSARIRPLARAIVALLSGRESTEELMESLSH
jgi:hypothetical protein